VFKNFKSRRNPQHLQYHEQKRMICKVVAVAGDAPYGLPLATFEQGLR
jgi:hypothetical protein